MSPIKRFLLMLALTLMWSPSFLFIKLALYDFPPITIACLRVSMAAGILGLILLYKRTALPMTREFWLRTFVMAFFASMLPFCLFCYAEQSIDSALAALLNGTSPMFTALLAHLFIASDRMTPQKAVGIFLSSCGIVFLFAPQLQSGVNGTLLGMSAGIIATICYAISHVYAKIYLTGQKPYVAPASQLLASALMLWPCALWHDDFSLLGAPSLSSLIGVCGLALFGTVVAFIIYYKLLDCSGPTAISMVACFFPVGGMLLGFIFLGESFSTASLLASALILFGMLLVNNVIALNFLKPKTAEVKEIS